MAAGALSSTLNTPSGVLFVLASWPVDDCGSQGVILSQWTPMVPFLVVMVPLATKVVPMVPVEMIFPVVV